MDDREVQEPLLPHDATGHDDGSGEGLPTRSAGAEDGAALAARVSAGAAAHAAKLRRAGKFGGQGYSRGWIAERFGVTAQTVANWETTEEYLEGYRTEESRMARAADMALTKIALSLPELIATSIAVAKDTTHKDSSVERRYLIDKVLTPMTIQHSTVQHTADVRFWEPVAAALGKVAQLAPVAMPQLLEGKEAAAQYGAATAAAQPVVDAEVVAEGDSEATGG